jgi:hypothetical protein
MEEKENAHDGDRRKLHCCGRKVARWRA